MKDKVFAQVFMLSLLFLLFNPSITVQAQVIGGTQSKLFDLYLLEKYEECYMKAFKMTESDKTKYDAEPFFYVAMCCLKFVDMPDYAELYPNALKDAYKYAGKAVKLVEKANKKELETISLEENAEFINELIRRGCEEARFQYVEEKFSKAAYYYKQLIKLREEDPAIKLALGGNHLLNRNVVEGTKLAEEGWKGIKEAYGSGDIAPDEVTVDALKVGIMAYSRWLNENGSSSKAKEIAEFGKNLMPDDVQMLRYFENL